MCGIFGVAGKLGSIAHDKFLKDAVQTGSLRGAHATGVAHVFYDQKDKSKLHCNTAKLAVPGWEFVHKTEAKILTTCSNSLAIIGHNRYATGGGMQDEHAHPFVRGSIALVHNGVIDNWRELCQRHGVYPYLLGATVDSDALTAVMAAADDKKDVLEHIDGAFSLVWFDSDDNSINFARNSERPMHFAGIDGGFLFGSEPAMLRWLADRNDLKILATSELSVGTHVKLLHDGKGFLESTSTDFTPKVRSRTNHTWYLGGSYDSAYDTSHVGNHSRFDRGNSSQSSQPNNTGNSPRVNKSGRTYAQVVQGIEKRLEHEAVYPGVVHDFHLTYLDTSDTARVIMHMTSTELGHLKACKYLYSTLSNRSRTVTHDRVEAELVQFLIKNHKDVSCVTAEPTSVILFSSTKDARTWEDRTTEETFSDGAWRYIIDTESIVLYASTESGGHVEIFNFRNRVRELDSEMQLVKGRTYRVTGVSEQVKKSTYKGEPIVVYEGPSKTDPSGVLVSPVTSKGKIVLLVPRNSIAFLEA